MGIEEKPQLGKLPSLHHHSLCNVLPSFFSVESSFPSLRLPTIFSGETSPRNRERYPNIFSPHQCLSPIPEIVGGTPNRSHRAQLSSFSGDDSQRLLVRVTKPLLFSCKENSGFSGSVLFTTYWF